MRSTSSRFRRALLTIAAAAPLALGVPAAPAATAAVAVDAAATADAGIQAPPGAKKVTATLFQWRFADVARECVDVLGPRGYGYVEVSPASEHIQGPQWWTVYQPVSYQIAGRLGNRAAFQNMVATCHGAGVKVIADVVINHMTSGSGTGTGGTAYTKYGYPGTYQSQDFHSCRREIANYGDRGEVQNCELVGLADLDTGASYVRDRIADYLDDLASLGVDGFRVDAAKHMAAADLAAIKSLTSNPSAFWVHEVIHGAGEPVQPGEYVGSGDVDEFRYAYDLKRVFTSERLAYLSNFGQAWGHLPDAQARAFVDNWDTERNGSTLNRTYGSTYTLANVFMLAWPYGAPNVFSGYDFTDHDAGPPNGGAVTACFQQGWTCQHAWPQIANMVGFRNAVGTAGVTNWWSNGANAISFSRGSAGHVVINRETSPITRTFQTSLPAGRYCDVQHGDPAQGCRGGHVHTVGADGRFAATVGAGDAIALHVGARPATGAEFSVQATTSFGQSVFVVGSTAALGAWNPAAAVPLSSAAYPSWRMGVGAAGGSFQYKYLRKDAGGGVTWEGGANRTATVPATGFVPLNDTWRP